MRKPEIIKLLHIADVHLGKTFRILGHRGAAQRRALQEALERAVGIAVEQHVQLVLVAGDLFDSPKPPETVVQFVIRQLRRLDDAGIRVAIVAGNHDLAPDGFVARSAELAAASPQLMLFGPSAEIRTLPDLDLTVIGRSANPDRREGPLAGWPKERATRFAVGITHGSVYRARQVEGLHTIHPQEIRGLGLDYLALGDWHSAFQVLPPPTAAWYAGAPEWLAFDQDNYGYALLVELLQPEAAKVTPVRTGRRRAERREINAADLDEAGLRRLLEETADPELVFEAVLTGLVPLQRMIDAEAVERDLADRFFRLRVHNRAQVWIDEAALSDLPEQTVLGKFVRIMRGHIAEADDAHRPLLEEAMQVGVALLSGREVLT